MFLLFFCGKYRNYAEDADFSELCGSASPHPVRCHVSYCENLSIYFSNHPFKFQRNRPVHEYFTSFFSMGCQKAKWMLCINNRGSLGGQVARVTRYKYCFTKCPRIVKYHHTRQEHHSRSLFYTKIRFWR